MLNDSEQLETLRAVAEPICQLHGLALLDARFTHERGLVLRVLIERSDPSERAGERGAGVSLADCQKVSRDLSTALDVREDATLPATGYRLEVSSPGIERPLISLADYDRFRGREVRVRTARALEGRRRFSGTLLGVDGDDVRLGLDGGEVRIPHAHIAKAHLVVRY